MFWPRNGGIHLRRQRGKLWPRIVAYFALDTLICAASTIVAVRNDRRVVVAADGMLTLSRKGDVLERTRVCKIHQVNGVIIAYSGFVSARELRERAVPGAPAAGISLYEHLRVALRHRGPWRRSSPERKPLPATRFWKCSGNCGVTIRKDSGGWLASPSWKFSLRQWSKAYRSWPNAPTGCERGPVQRLSFRGRADRAPAPVPWSTGCLRWGWACTGKLIYISE